MKEYDLYFPLAHNDGRPVSPDKLVQFKRLLVEEFGGLTHFPQENEGLWKLGRTTFRDRVVILRVLADEVERARAFLRALRVRLEAELEQASILIVERDVRLME